jgi:4-amino-4-deoxy-L-arabinose transferase-like glycosyltransferase
MTPQPCAQRPGALLLWPHAAIHRGRQFTGWFASKAPLPLLAILGVQSSLTLRLVWANTAFTDEALYLRAGHLEIAHLLHGMVIPAFPTYFSGAPVIYPPLAALADSVAGLAGARILSLFFMLGATSLLWAVAGRLYDHRAAFFSAAIFALLGTTIRLGAFATFDAMALFLLALSVWCIVRSAAHPRASGWLVAAAFAMAAANATKYPSALFDPVIVGVLILLTLPGLTIREALARAGTLVAYVAGVLCFLLVLGGGEYVTGIEQTTLLRVQGTSAAHVVLGQAWSLTSVVVVLAATAVLTCALFEKLWSRRLLVMLMATAVILVPIEQARIHTTTSLSKHVDFGVWFAAVAAGFLVSSILRVAPWRTVRAGVFVVSLASLTALAWMGLGQAQAIFRSWPNSAALITTLDRLLPGTRGPILDDSNRALAEYYLPAQGDQWYRWSNDTSLRLPHGRSVSVPVASQTGSKMFTSRVRTGYFSVVILNFTSASWLDQRLLPALEANAHYQLTAAVPYGSKDSEIWEYRPSGHFESLDLSPPTPPGTPLGSLLTPAIRPRAILGTLGSTVIFSGAGVLLITVLIRLGWRRGKASDEI